MSKKRNERVHSGFTVASIVDDIFEHLGIVIVAEAGHGKSYTAFTLVKEAMTRKDVSCIIFSPSTIWRRKFGAVNCVKVGTSVFNPVVPRERVQLYESNLARDTVWVNIDKKWSFQWSSWLKDLLDSKQHLLFEIKYKNGRRIKHFESQILKYLYAQQERQLDINPKYNHHFIVLFEELQNAFGTYSMNSDDSLELFTVFTQSRSDAHIHYIGIGQRLNDISTKICERLRPLVGLTVGENSLRKIRSMLPKHLKEKVQQLPQRTWIYLDGKTNPIIEIPKYHKQGKSTFLKPTLKPQSTSHERLITKAIFKKPSLAKRFFNWLFGLTPAKPKIVCAYSDEEEQEDDEFVEEIDTTEGRDEEFVPM